MLDRAIAARGSRLMLSCALMAAAASSHAARPRIYAITGATIAASPGRTLEGATVVFREGLIEAVGTGVKVPADAVAIDGRGLFVYPGLIDAGGWSPASEPAPAAGERSRGARAATAPEAGPLHALPLVRPERRASDALLPFDGDRRRDAESWRKLGFTALLAAPTKGVFRGSSALVLLADDTPVRDLIVKEQVAQHVAFETLSFGEGYPTSVMGAAAAIRQTLLDAQRHAAWVERWEKNPAGMPRPERSPASEALGPVLARTQPMFLDAQAPEDVLLADRIAREFSITLVPVGSGAEGELADQVARTGRTIVLPARFPDKPKVDDPDEALDASLRELRRYVDAPAVAKTLRDAGMTIVLSAHGLKNTADFTGNVRKMIDAGLPRDAAVEALTAAPAKLLSVDRVMGTIEPGKIANLVVADGPLFAKDTKIRRVFVDGTDYPVEERAKPAGDPNAVVDPRGTWSVSFEAGGQTIQRTWTIAGEKGAYTGTAETRSGTVTFDAVALVGNALTVTFPAAEGRGSNEVTVIVAGDTFEGSMEIGPRTTPVKGTRTRGPEGGR